MEDLILKKQNNNELLFKEFDFETAKSQLPDGYTPIPYIPVRTRINRNAKICVHGIFSENAALEFIRQYAPIFPANSFAIRKHWCGVNECEYQIAAPYELVPFIAQNKDIYSTVIVKKTAYESNRIPPVLYRTIGKENVNKLFENGELLLSTFMRCRKLENDARRDKYELRNSVVIQEKDKRIETDAQYNNDLLVLCTSLSPMTDTPDRSAMIKITDVQGFFEEITKTLVQMNFIVAEVLYGPCVYNDKVLVIETNYFVSYIMDTINSSEKFPTSEISEFVYNHAEDDIIMNKPTKFQSEQEYRFVWKLLSPFTEDSLLITNPNLVNYCERVE